MRIWNNTRLGNVFSKLLGYGVVQSAILAILLNIIIEGFGRQSILEGFGFMFKDPKVFFYNAFIIFVTLSISLLVKRRIFSYILISSAWLALGITNGVVLSFRMTPFTVSDFALFENGISILPNYMSTLEIVLAVLGAVVLIIAFIIAFRRAPKRKKKINYKLNILLIVVFVLSLYGLTNLGIKNWWLSTYFSNLGYAYRDYGVAYCFTNTWLNRGISTPNKYSEELIISIFEDGIPVGNNKANPLIPVTLTAGGEVESKPNIIFVQLESFIDPYMINGLKFSKDPIPNFRRLKREYSSGYLRVPSVGAGTANTEFEVLTGMRIMSFGPGEYPYKTVLKKTTCESINYILKDMGYSSHAIHNHRGAFYGRDEIFSKLGFDTFTSLEYMNDVKKTPGNWAKDFVLKDEIFFALEATKDQDFILAISVQGHGRYPETKRIPDEELEVRITEGVEDEADLNAMEYYVQQIYEMDQFIGDLVAELEDYHEEAVVVFYGDHLPVLNLTSDDLVTYSVYETEYVIYSNFDLRKIDEDLASYQLTAQVFELLGIQKGILPWYHQTRKNYGNYLDNLEILQYDMLYGENYVFGMTNPFEATDLRLGIRDIRVDEIFDFAGSTYVIGENFTPYSKVLVKDDFVDTVFVNPQILRIPGGAGSSNPKDFAISQVGKYNYVLSTLDVE